MSIQGYQVRTINLVNVDYNSIELQGKDDKFFNGIISLTPSSSHMGNGS